MMPHDTAQQADGYVKYRAVTRPAPPPIHPLLPELDEVRTVLHEAALLGRHPDGMSFGNLSLREKNSRFIITGTNTGQARKLGQHGYCLVTSFDVRANEVRSQGPLAPSSEAMSHGVIYRANPRIQCVIHIHSRFFFDWLHRQGYPSTPENAACGTPALATAIDTLIAAAFPATDLLFFMKGHDEGIIACGATINAAKTLLLSTLTTALQQTTSPSSPL